MVNIKVNAEIPNRHNFKGMRLTYDQNVYFVLGTVYPTKEDIRDKSFGGNRIRNVKVFIKDSLLNKIKANVNVIKIPTKNDESNPIKVTFSIDLPDDTPNGNYYLRIIQISADGKTLEPLMDYKQAYRFIIESMKHNKKQNLVHEVVQPFNFVNKKYKGIQNTPESVDTELTIFENEFRRSVEINIGHARSEQKTLFDLINKIMSDFSKIPDNKHSFLIKNVDDETKALIKELKKIFLKEHENKIFSVLNANLEILLNRYPQFKSNREIIHEVELFKMLDDQLQELINLLDEMEKLTEINSFLQLKQKFNEFHSKFERFKKIEQSSHKLLHEMIGESYKKAA